MSATRDRMFVRSVNITGDMNSLLTDLEKLIHPDNREQRMQILFARSQLANATMWINKMIHTVTSQ